jgi:hypothetical protein
MVALLGDGDALNRRVLCALFRAPKIGRRNQLLKNALSAAAVASGCSSAM